jgi:hypothetical protein
MLNFSTKIIFLCSTFVIVAHASQSICFKSNNIYENMQCTMLFYYYILGRARQNFYCDDSLNEQIKMEFDAAQTYLSLVIKF